MPVDDPEERIGIDKIRLEAQLRDSLDTGTLEVRYQPLYDIPAGRVTSYEALVRWELPERGVVSPAEFIKLAEETSLIVPVGEYVLDRVLEVLTGLRDAGVEPLPSIAVNLSAKQLVEPGMARQIVVARASARSLPRGRAQARGHRKPHARLRAGARGDAALPRAWHAVRAGRFRHRVFQPHPPVQTRLRIHQGRPGVRAAHVRQPARDGAGRGDRRDGAWHWARR